MARRGKGQTALVTGASGGIGLDLARLLAEDGFGLVLVARSAQKLRDLCLELGQKHDVTARALPADLADPKASEAIWAALQKDQVELDILVNNAGYGVFGRFASETDTRLELEMIQVNVTALTHLTKLVLPGMLKRGRGRIMNVASTAAFLPGPLMAVYYATKAYVLSISEALANELEGTGVTVTVLCPGPTTTGFQKAANMQDSGLMKSPLKMDSLTVARAGYAGMLDGAVLVVPGIQNKIMTQSVRVTPRALVRKLVRLYQDRR
jgi:hypothetical protein